MTAIIVYRDEVVETEYCEKCNLHYPVGDRCNCETRVILLPPSSLCCGQCGSKERLAGPEGCQDDFHNVIPRAMEIGKPIRLRLKDDSCPNHTDGRPCGTGRSLALRSPDSHLGAIRD